MNTTQFITICILIASFNFIWNYFSKNRSNITSGNPTPEHNESSVNAALEKPETSVLIFSTALALLPLLSGFWFLNGWLNEYNIAEDTMSWNAYPGVMLSKKITLNTNNNDTGHQLSGRTYDAVVEYEFTYNNKTIKWNRIDYLNRPSHGNKSIPQSLLDSLPDAGEKVTVYFSPEKRQAVLITGAKNSNYFGLIGGGIFFIIGLIWMKFIYS